MHTNDYIMIQVMDQKLKYPAGTTLEQVAKDVCSNYDAPITLARVDGHLSELSAELIPDSTIDFVTIEDKAGMEAYRRSATLILSKAVADLYGPKVDLIVDFSMHKGYYCDIVGYMPLDVEQLNRIKERMDTIISQDIKIIKQTVSLTEAAKVFESYGMEEKVRLLKYCKRSDVNIYMLDNYADYYYGYMVPSSGYIRLYELIPYKNGFVIQMPSSKSPNCVLPFKPSEKIFNVLKESTNWGEQMGVLNAGELNEIICDDGFLDLMLVSEALQEKSIANIAEEIYKSKKRIVLIAGPSSSGKTTFSHRLSVQLRVKGLKPHPIPVDNYFVDRELTPKDEHGNYDFECLGALNITQFNKDLLDLLEGKRVEMPYFNFVTGKSEYGKNNYLQIGSDDVLVIEGIHCLNDELTISIPKEDKFRIYISALTFLNLDEHNRIATTDGRLIRRMVRDAAKRGTPAAGTIGMWYSVRRGEEKNIFPYQDNADAYFNTSLVYEFSVLKQYAEPLLFHITPDQPEYEEARRLLNLLDYFVGTSSENIPKNSILREFVGGSYFDV